MNFLLAVLIGAVVGAAVGYLLRGRNTRAMVYGPVAGIVGGLIASALATMLGDPGYGWKEATLQVLLAAGGAAAAVFVLPGAASDQPGPVTTTE